MAVQWSALDAFITLARVQFLVEELGFHKICSAV